ncbi:unnamed protein product [Ambrosiozyma monospora]|uniref:Unnamed protein product n=1 Tax=Ambrosiozyma monospora TaxID=43982 RepID=A0A9W7DF71_AMBMO|nr:unnamed protein product [Ambrosiozyma monospora]
MDMGGASTQIAFVPSDPAELKKHKEDLYSVKLRNVNGETQDWSVFVSTWLGFGANQARKRHLRNLILALPEGVNYDQDGDGDYDLIDPCAPRGMIIEQEHDGINYEITGSGDYKTCMKLIYPLLLKHLPCRDSPCLFNGVHAPTIDFKKDKFVGVSEYWYTANDVFKMGGDYNFLKFEEGLKDFCELDWSEIEGNFNEGKYGTTINLPLLKDSCFKAAWVVNVLHEGFELPRIGFETDATSKLNEIDEEFAKTVPFQSANLIDGAELSWTLGKMLLFASSQVPSKDKAKIGVIPAETSKFIFSSSAGVKPKQQVKIGPDRDSLYGGGFFYFFMTMLLFLVIAFGLYQKKFGPRGGKFSNIHFPPTMLSSKIQLERSLNQLKNSVKKFYYQRIASREAQHVYFETQNSLQLEEGFGGETPNNNGNPSINFELSLDSETNGNTSTQGNSNALSSSFPSRMQGETPTLRTRSTLNLQNMVPTRTSSSSSLSSSSSPPNGYNGNGNGNGNSNTSPHSASSRSSSQHPGLRNAISLTSFPVFNNGGSSGFGIDRSVSPSRNGNGLNGGNGNVGGGVGGSMLPGFDFMGRKYNKFAKSPVAAGLFNLNLGNLSGSSLDLSSKNND